MTATVTQNSPSVYPFHWPWICLDLLKLFMPLEALFPFGKWSSSAPQKQNLTVPLRWPQLFLTLGIANRHKMTCLKKMLSSKSPIHSNIPFLSSWVYKWRSKGPKNTNEFLFFPRNPLNGHLLWKSTTESLFCHPQSCASDSLKNDSTYNGALFSTQKNLYKCTIKGLHSNSKQINDYNTKFYIFPVLTPSTFSSK